MSGCRVFDLVMGEMRWDVVVREMRRINGKKDSFYTLSTPIACDPPPIRQSHLNSTLSAPYLRYLICSLVPHLIELQRSANGRLSTYTKQVSPPLLVEAVAMLPPFWAHGLGSFP